MLVDASQPALGSRPAKKATVEPAPDNEFLLFCV